jgi:very-short-patch-repair endonuclease
VGGTEGGGNLVMSDNKTTIAKALRRRLTDSERLLWRHLRSKQIEGNKFRRQEPLGKYVVDFVCHEKRIVIEVDGSQHSIDKGIDKARDKWLKEQRYNVLRFWNNEVLTNVDGVLEVIRNTLLSPSLNPSHQGREGKRVNNDPTRERLR